MSDLCMSFPHCLLVRMTSVCMGYSNALEFFFSGREGGFTLSTFFLERKLLGRRKNGCEPLVASKIGCGNRAFYVSVHLRIPWKGASVAEWDLFHRLLLTLCVHLYKDVRKGGKRILEYALLYVISWREREGGGKASMGFSFRRKKELRSEKN